LITLSKITVKVKEVGFATVVTAMKILVEGQVEVGVGVEKKEEKM
jgi:hypothetical protein